MNPMCENVPMGFAGWDYIKVSLTEDCEIMVLDFWAGVLIGAGAVILLMWAWIFAAKILGE